MVEVDSLDITFRFGFCLTSEPRDSGRVIHTTVSANINHLCPQNVLYVCVGCAVFNT